MLADLVRCSCLRKAKGTEMKTWFIVLLLFGFCGTASVYGVDPTRSRVAPPQVIMRPQVTMVPYEHLRTDIIRREFRTPLRDWLIGRERVRHIYAPQVTR